MTLAPYLSLILPAYNEVKGIKTTIDSIRAHFGRRNHSYEIIVCADGNDGTRELVTELARTDSRLTVLGDSRRGGKGLAIRMGVAQARGRIIGFADADNKVPIAETDHVLPWLNRGYDIVIGSRGLADSHVEVPAPLHRRLGSRAFAVGMHALVGLHGITDTQCGFKFFLAPVATHLFSQQRVDGYMFDVEVLYLAERCGYRIKEVGVRWRDDGDTRLQLIAGNWRNVIDLLRVRFGRYECRPVPSSSRQALGQARKAG
jgi:glycosyltransferase involved in cell wall biosynthesis